MTFGEALGVLGLQPGVAWIDVRSTYRTMIRTHHPDRAGPSATGRAATITEAYAVLEATWGDHAAVVESRTSPGKDAAGAPSSAHEGSVDATAARTSAWQGGSVEVIGGDSVALDTDVESAFAVLLDAAYDIGEVSFVDSSMGLVETVVKFAGTPSCSLVVTMQGRSDHIEAFCSIESLEGTTAPPVTPVVEVFADLVRQRLGTTLDRPVQAPAEWLVDEHGRPGRTQR
ncbi:MAG: J domain-containing protein [Acidimicrobiales bacterium]